MSSIFIMSQTFSFPNIMFGASSSNSFNKNNSNIYESKTISKPYSLSDTFHQSSETHFESHNSSKSRTYLSKKTILATAVYITFPISVFVISIYLIKYLYLPKDVCNVKTGAIVTACFSLLSIVLKISCGIIYSLVSAKKINMDTRRNSKQPSMPTTPVTPSATAFGSYSNAPYGNKTVLHTISIAFITISLPIIGTIIGGIYWIIQRFILLDSFNNKTATSQYHENNTGLAKLTTLEIICFLLWIVSIVIQGSLTVFQVIHKTIVHNANSLHANYKHSHTRQAAPPRASFGIFTQKIHYGTHSYDTQHSISSSVPPEPAKENKRLHFTDLMYSVGSKLLFSVPALIFSHASIRKNQSTQPDYKTYAQSVQNRKPLTNSPSLCYKIFNPKSGTTLKRLHTPDSQPYMSTEFKMKTSPETQNFKDIPGAKNRTGLNSAIPRYKNRDSHSKDTLSEPKALKHKTGNGQFEKIEKTKKKVFKFPMPFHLLTNVDPKACLKKEKHVPLHDHVAVPIRSSAANSSPRCVDWQKSNDAFFKNSDNRINVDEIFKSKSRNCFNKNKSSQYIGKNIKTGYIETAKEAYSNGFQVNHLRRSSNVSENVSSDSNICMSLFESDINTPKHRADTLKSNSQIISRRSIVNKNTSFGFFENSSNPTIFINEKSDRDPKNRTTGINPNPWIRKQLLQAQDRALPADSFFFSSDTHISVGTVASSYSNVHSITDISHDADATSFYRSSSNNTSEIMTEESHETSVNSFHGMNDASSICDGKDQLKIVRNSSKSLAFTDYALNDMSNKGFVPELSELNFNKGCKEILMPLGIENSGMVDIGLGSSKRMQSPLYTGHKKLVSSLNQDHTSMKVNGDLKIGHVQESVDAFHFPPLLFFAPPIHNSVYHAGQQSFQNAKYSSKESVIFGQASSTIPFGNDSINKPNPIYDKPLSNIGHGNESVGLVAPVIEPDHNTSTPVSSSLLNSFSTDPLFKLGNTQAGLDFFRQDGHDIVSQQKTPKHNLVHQVSFDNFNNFRPASVAPLVVRKRKNISLPANKLRDPWEENIGKNPILKSFENCKSDSPVSGFVDSAEMVHSFTEYGPPQLVTNYNRHTTYCNFKLRNTTNTKHNNHKKTSVKDNDPENVDTNLEAPANQYLSENESITSGTNSNRGSKIFNQECLEVKLAPYDVLGNDCGMFGVPSYISREYKTEKVPKLPKRHKNHRFSVADVDFY